jgi:hypothetical protein
VSGPRERDAIVPMIQHQIRHADEHVLFNVRIKLPIYFS